MSKFINSEESIDSSLLLWQENTTQVAIEDIYDLKVHPVSSLFNDGAINFDLPPQPKGLLSNVDVITTFSIKYGTNSNKVGSSDQVSVVNNIANSLWTLVDVKIDDRVSLMQSMRNSYAYQTFFNNALNHDNVHEDYLFANELFLMDTASNKATSEGMIFGKVEGKEITNDGAVKRADRVRKGKSITTFSKLHCPLLTTNKALPTAIKIRISLTRNTDAFLLLSDDPGYKLIIEDIYLLATFQKPRDAVLKIMDERLLKSPAIYYVTKPEIIVRPITQTSKVIRMNDLFQEKLPKYAFFCIQGSEDFEGKISKNPYTFIPFSKFQFYVNGTPYFADPLEIDSAEGPGDSRVYSENAIYLRQLYKTIGKDLRGNCLINRDNFQLNFIVGLSLTSDRCSTICNHLNLQEVASTHLEIDIGEEKLPDDALLVIYAMYDRQILINSQRAVTIVE